jgi:hypothetical protein
MSYNGWSNWETWNTNLHLFDGLTARDISGTRTVTADECEEFVQTFLDEVEGPNGFVADIIGGFMSEVNWREIAEHLNEDEDEEEGNE